MSKSVIATLLAVATVIAILAMNSRTSGNDEFRDWMQQYGKNYASKYEELYR